MHAGHGQLPVDEYLSPALLDLLAFAVVGLMTVWVVRIFEAITKEAASQSEAEHR